MPAEIVPPGDPAHSPIDLYVVDVRRDQFLHVYHLRTGCTREQRMAVLAEIHETHPNCAVRTIGLQIAVSVGGFGERGS